MQVRISRPEIHNPMLAGSSSNPVSSPFGRSQFPIESGSGFAKRHAGYLTNLYSGPIVALVRNVV